jgi:hypothetical protein
LGRYARFEEASRDLNVGRGVRREILPVRVKERQGVRNALEAQTLDNNGSQSVWTSRISFTGTAFVCAPGPWRRYGGFGASGMDGCK